MSRHEGNILLRHMLNHAREAVAMAGGRTRGDLDTDRQLNLSLVRLLEIVGEAAGRVPAEERGSHGLNNDRRRRWAGRNDLLANLVASRPQRACRN
jgi:uncharacterized protein with HEPN domain